MKAVCCIQYEGEQTLGRLMGTRNVLRAGSQSFSTGKEEYSTVSQGVIL